MAKVKMSRMEREMDALMKRVAKELKAKERLMHPKERETLESKAKNWSSVDGRPDAAPEAEEASRMFQEMKVRDF